jgi:hypothetical protein
MLNLYWHRTDGTRNLVEESFKTEQQLESFIFKNQELLGGDVVIIHQQIHTGNKQGIPDMIGVDQSGRICIIEIKNVVADESILPQALGYALWAEANPDSIKAIWLESKNAPDDIQVNWSELGIRVILIAPGFKANVQRMVTHIGFDVDLVQIRRFRLDDDVMLLVEVLDQEQPAKPGLTTVKGDWTWEYYEQEHGKAATAEFRSAVETLARHVSHHGWDLPYNLNKEYTGFKLGNKVVFEVAWHGTHSWKVRAKLDKQVAEEMRGSL